MLPTPWKSFAAPRDGKEYVALLSFLPLKRYRTIPKLARLAMETMGQLGEIAWGLIGYSLGAELTPKRFWTVSAWEDRQSLRDFVERFRTAGSCRSLRRIWARRDLPNGPYARQRFQFHGPLPVSTC